MLTKESMTKLVEFFQSYYINCEIESHPGRSQVGFAYGLLPSYIVKISTTDYIDDQIVSNIRGYILDAGLDHEHIGWKIQDDHVHYFGKLKENDKLRIKKK